jgi:hypothetical protein
LYYGEVNLSFFTENRNEILLVNYNLQHLTYPNLPVPIFNLQRGVPAVVVSFAASFKHDTKLNSNLLTDNRFFRTLTLPTIKSYCHETQFIDLHIHPAMKPLGKSFDRGTPV